MLIHGRGAANPEVVDHDLARAIGEAPPRRRPLLKQDPGAADLLGCEKMQIGQLFLEQLSSRADRQRRVPSRHKERQQLINAVVGGHQLVIASVIPLTHGSMVNIATDQKSESHPSINEGH